LVLGLLSDLPRKNCWTIAEWAGEATPDGMQHLLGRAKWKPTRYGTTSASTWWSTWQCPVSVRVMRPARSGPRNRRNVASQRIGRLAVLAALALAANPFVPGVAGPEHAHRAEDAS
jgi:hypothetical protein